MARSDLPPHQPWFCCLLHLLAAISPRKSRRIGRINNVIKGTTKNVKPRLVWGFTTIELLVTAAIFALISSIVLVNNSRFNSSLLLGNLAYDIALSVREAQTYGLNVRGAATGGGTIFTAGYGVTFRGAMPSRYEFFADLDGDKVNDLGNELLRYYDLRGNYQLGDICGIGAEEKRYCTSDDSIDGLSIVVTRPNPDAVIRSLDGVVTYASAEVTLMSPQGTTRTVTVGSTGQISIQ